MLGGLWAARIAAYIKVSLTSIVAINWNSASTRKSLEGHRELVPFTFSARTTNCRGSWEVSFHFTAVISFRHLDIWPVHSRANNFSFLYKKKKKIFFSYVTELKFSFFAIRLSIESDDNFHCQRIYRRNYSITNPRLSPSWTSNADKTREKEFLFSLLLRVPWCVHTNSCESTEKYFRFELRAEFHFLTKLILSPARSVVHTSTLLFRRGF